MAKLEILKAATDVSLYIFIQDSSQTDGRGLTGLVYNSASLVCYYVRPLGSAAALTLATQTVTGAHSDGGFVEVSSANMPGVYRLDLSDAVCATGVNSVVVMLKGATNMAPVVLEIQLVSYDPNDSVPAVDVTQWNGTAVATPGVAGVPEVNVTSITTGAIVSGSFATGALSAIADAVLLRDWTAIIATVPARCALNALRAIRNKWSIALGVLTVTKEDDTTTVWTSAITTDANAEGITGSDPT